MQTARFVKKAAGFALCFVVAFMMSRYGMPLYSLTAWIVDHSHLVFGRYQADVYEAGTDPVTFFALLAVITLYAAILFGLIRMVVRKLKAT
ncbi:hypothetical protein GC090_22085 (plasmid) [Pantoea sp. JZ29]|uniref:hypothetical protein n=1 Tax=Pantoea sp. JZ29 TaxID=2654192 RepID=UPI002B462D13|nr:hypothetical protein [Pantoea sp. JZ29]WRH23344.1 hypothetical protein GC090_22085 [Pantoea sp. JZ29]